MEESCSGRSYSKDDLKNAVKAILNCQLTVQQA